MTVPEYRWRKARSSGQEANCVEIARDRHGDLVGVRDSKAPSGGVLTAGVRELLTSARDGRLGGP